MEEPRGAVGGPGSSLDQPVPIGLFKVDLGDLDQLDNLDDLEAGGKQR
jgi:hypothetical protein